MKTQNKIEKLQQEVERLKIEQGRCKHDWGVIKYDPDKVLVRDDRKGYETQGVDRWATPSFHEENKDRWSRECNKCGIKDYTYDREIISVEKRPKFN